MATDDDGKDPEDFLLKHWNLAMLGVGWLKLSLGQ
jgi:hypothetical protein